jgi:DNA repair exonuclease SbcCD ATPase subunit
VKEIQKRNWDNLTDIQFKNQYLDCAKQVTIKLNHKKNLTKEQNDKISEATTKKIKSAKKSYDKIKKSTEKKIAEIEEMKSDYEKCLQGKILHKKLSELKERKNELNSKLKEAEQKFKDTKRIAQTNSKNREIAVNTAMANYSNPKVAYSLCKSSGHEPIVIYSKSLVERFNVWANATDKEYWKKYPNI